MKLLFNYLPYSMKDTDSSVRSIKKASTKETTNGSDTNTKITKFFSSFYSSTNKNNTTTTTVSKNGTIKKRVHKSNGSEDKFNGKKRKIYEDDNINSQRGTKAITNGTKRRKSISSSQVSTASSSSSNSSSTIVNGKSSSSCTPTKRNGNNIVRASKGNNKSSPKLRPRRRASQTYFFKYQLARNPLKAEEEDLKLALLASLQHNGGSNEDQPLNISNDNNNNTSNTTNISSNGNNKQPKKGTKGNSNQQQPNKQQKQKHPPPQKTVAQNYLTRPPAYDEEYLKRYRPETEDFLTFICFRLHNATNFTSSTPPKNESSNTTPTASGSIEQLPLSINLKPSNGCMSTNTGIKVKVNNDKFSNEFQNLRRSASPCKSSASNHTASNSSPNHLNSPCNRRRPTRHSPRLANTGRKISELDNLNHYTAYNNQITYEEDMKRASIALEDMAQEMNGSDDQDLDHNQLSKNVDDCLTSSTLTPGFKSLSPYKNNKHLVKGLMTREFAGAFADEEIIFESIKNHNL